MSDGRAVEGREPEPSALRYVEDDGGDYLWWKGHDLTDVEIRVAVAIWAAKDCGFDRIETLDTALSATIRRAWFRPDPRRDGDDENYQRVDSGAEGAEAFTEAVLPL
jgi:hypothetical protein